MISMSENPVEPQDAAHPEWFREPTPREHRIGAWLFLGFGVFFVLCFIVEKDWSFRWVMLALGTISIGRGVRHAVKSRQKKG